jgi:hypothetical protein
MSKRRKIALVGNINSGVNVSDYRKYGRYDSFNKLARMVKNYGGRVYVTGNSYDYFSEAERQIELVCKYLPRVVIIHSGDGGAVVTFITLLIKSWPNKKQPFPLLALLDGGSFGVLANRLNANDSVQQVKDILNAEKLSDLAVKDIKLMRVEDDSGKTHYSFSVGVGFPVRLLQEAYKKKHLKNLRVVMMTGRAIGSATLSTFLKTEYYRIFEGQQKMTVTTTNHDDDDETFKAEWLGIIAQTINSVGLPKGIPYRQKLFWKAEEAENTFHAIGVDYGFRRLLWEAPRIYIGEAGTYRDRETNQERRVLLLDKQVKSLEISSSEESFEFQSSGDLFPPTHKLLIHSHPIKIRFIDGNNEKSKKGLSYINFVNKFLARLKSQS